MAFFRLETPDRITNFAPLNGPPTCIVCGNAGGVACAGCQANMYCSILCQNQDWEYHQRVCSGYTDVTDDKRPDNTHFRALWLRHDETNPVWFWLKTKKTDLDGDSIFYSSVNERLKIDPREPLVPFQILHEHIPQEGLSHGLMALITLDHTQGGSEAQPNHVIAALSRQGQPTLYDSVIVIAYQSRITGAEGGLPDVVVVEDLHMRDFRKIVEAYQRYEHMGYKASPFCQL